MPKVKRRTLAGYKVFGINNLGGVDEYSNPLQLEDNRAQELLNVRGDGAGSLKRRGGVKSCIRIKDENVMNTNAYFFLFNDKLYSLAFSIGNRLNFSSFIYDRKTQVYNMYQNTTINLPQVQANVDISVKSSDLPFTYNYSTFAGAALIKHPNNPNYAIFVFNIDTGGILRILRGIINPITLDITWSDTNLVYSGSARAIIASGREKNFYVFYFDADLRWVVDIYSCDENYTPINMGSLLLPIEGLYRASIDYNLYTFETVAIDDVLVGEQPEYRGIRNINGTLRFVLATRYNMRERGGFNSLVADARGVVEWHFEPDISPVDDFGFQYVVSGNNFRNRTLSELKALINGRGNYRMVGIGWSIYSAPSYTVHSVFTGSDVLNYPLAFPDYGEYVPFRHYIKHDPVVFFYNKNIGRVYITTTDNYHDVNSYRGNLDIGTGNFAVFDGYMDIPPAVIVNNKIHFVFIKFAGSIIDNAILFREGINYSLVFSIKNTPQEAVVYKVSGVVDSAGNLKETSIDGSVLFSSTNDFSFATLFSRLWVAKLDSSNEVMFSDIASLNFPSTNKFIIEPTDGDSITAITAYLDKIIVFKRKNIYVIDGNPAIQQMNAIQIYKLNSKFGCKFPHSVVPIGQGVFFVGDGVGLLTSKGVVAAEVIKGLKHEDIAIPIQPSIDAIDPNMNQFFRGVYGDNSVFWVYNEKSGISGANNKVKIIEFNTLNNEFYKHEFECNINDLSYTLPPEFTNIPLVYNAIFNRDENLLLINLRGGLLLTFDEFKDTDTVFYRTINTNFNISNSQPPIENPFLSYFHTKTFSFEEIFSWKMLRSFLILADGKNTEFKVKIYMDENFVKEFTIDLTQQQAGSLWDSTLWDSALWDAGVLKKARTFLVSISQLRRFKTISFRFFTEGGADWVLRGYYGIYRTFPIRFGV